MIIDLTNIYIYIYGDKSIDLTQISYIPHSNNYKYLTCEDG